MALTDLLSRYLLSSRTGSSEETIGPTTSTSPTPAPNPGLALSPVRATAVITASVARKKSPAPTARTMKRVFLPDAI